MAEQIVIEDWYQAHVWGGGYYYTYIKPDQKCEN